MPFPNYTTKKLLGLIPWRVRDGWEDRGKVKGNNTYYPERHGFCKTIVRIARENEKIFKYCPKCLYKFKNAGP